jgi:hypothetical protein
MCSDSSGVNVQQNNIGKSWKITCTDKITSLHGHSKHENSTIFEPGAGLTYP